MNSTVPSVRTLPAPPRLPNPRVELFGREALRGDGSALRHTMPRRRLLGAVPAAVRPRLIGAGVDCITLGDHIYRRREIADVLQSQPNIVKPANFPKQAPGREYAVVRARNGVDVAVFSLLGRVFMRPVDCPWTAADRVLAGGRGAVREVIELVLRCQGHWQQVVEQFRSERI